VRRGVTACVAAALLASGCAYLPVVAPPAVGGDGGGSARPCTSTAVRSCALPFPSDEFTVADASTATGRRLIAPEGLLPRRVLDRLGPGGSPRDAVAGADGYSVVTPVIFELAVPVQPGSLPPDGGDVVALFDTTTGERVPLRASVPADAARHGAPDTIVMAWPRSRLRHGRTYVARVTDGLRARSGGPAPRAPGLARTSDPRVAALRADLARVEGDRWDRVVGATRFTVRSRGSATTQIDRMAGMARAAEHPIRNLRVAPPVFVEHASAVVTGEVLLSDFRDRNGVARAEHGARPTWERFVLVLPERAAGPAGAPVVIYGHGITASKETMLFTAATNAELGLATVGIDVPNHGDRQVGDGGYVLDLTSSRTFGRLASMPLQGVVDQVSLLEAVRDHFGTLDVVPGVRLDTSTLFYEGTSMGGVLGAAFVALAPELDGAFLQVAGAGIADIIMNSTIWPLFMGVVPAGATTGDAYALMGSATMLMDHAESANLLDRIRARGTPVFLAYGVGDGVVPNATSDRLISLLGLPLVGPRLTGISLPHRSTGREQIPADGRGVAQLWPFSSAEVQSFAAHIVFAQNRSVRLLEEWLAGRLRAEGVAAT
jgi:pimeloyl-ACP methyl ester carboxylesterase